VQGDTFAADPSQIGVLFILGPSEQFTQFDALAVRRFVTAGGTAVLASDTGLPESALLDTFDVQVAGPIGPGRYPIGGVTFADPPTHAIAIDRGIAFSLRGDRLLRLPPCDRTEARARDPARRAPAALEPRVHPRLRGPGPAIRTRRDRPPQIPARAPEGARARAWARSGDADRRHRRRDRD